MSTADQDYGKFQGESTYQAQQRQLVHEAAEQAKKAAWRRDLREKAAIAAMQGLLSGDIGVRLKGGEKSYEDAVARCAMDYADALIARLEDKT